MAAHVASPYDGIVVERLTDAGQSISAGSAIITVEPLNVPLQVLMFIPLEGKRIAPGMGVEMVPGGVQPEETGPYGYAPPPPGHGFPGRRPSDTS